MMNRAMKEQFDLYPVSSAMVLGIAGGNGLEHVDPNKYRKVYGVDINPLYLQETEQRYQDLEGTLECLCLDLISDADRLPPADLLIANLLVEYIGYGVFQEAVKTVSPAYVSCIIQINEGEGFVSDSPYLNVFDRLDEVHHQMEEEDLTKALEEVGYQKAASADYPLPNGKKLVRLDFRK